MDYTDAAGRRKWKTFEKTPEGKRQARIFAAECDRKLIRGEPGQDERITFKEASERWLLSCKAALSYQTWFNYSNAIKKHLGPRFNDRPLSKVSRAAFKLYITEVVAGDSLARSTVGTLVGISRAFFSWCVEEGLITTNPAATVLRALKLERRRKDTVKAMSRDQLSAFLGTAKRLLNEDGYLEQLLMARAGVRIGEAHGFHWGDFLDEDPPRMRVERQVTIHGIVKGPKTEKGRRLVDVSIDLRDALREAWIRRQECRLRHGIPMSSWVIHPEWGDAPGRLQVRQARRRVAENMRLVLKEGQLPHFTPHGLRHTHATLLLLQGEPVQYVQQQLGHATIAETVDTYGSWIQAQSPGAVDRLADRTRAKESASVGEFRSKENVTG